MGSIHSIGDFFDMVRRRLAIILCVAILGSVITVLFALNQRHLYISTEVLQLRSPKIATSLTPTTVEGSSARRLQFIEQQVMSRGTLLDVAQELELFTNADALEEGKKVELLRQSVTLRGVAAAREGYSDDGTVSLLRIAATWASPEGAQNLAREFSRRTQELSINSRLEQSLEALRFFELRERNLAAEVDALETEIAEFRANNDIPAPGSIAAAQREIERLNQSLLTIDREMISLQAQLARTPQTRVERREQDEARAAIARLTEERKLVSTPLAELQSSIEASPEIELQLARYELQLSQLREQLQAARTKHKEAAIAHDLEAEKQSERLTVLEPAPLPEYPYTSSRKKMVLLGGFASLLAGLALAFLLDLRRPVIRTAAQMEHALGLRPVVTIPEIDPRARRRKRKQRK
ncbi:DUF874 domain-containing protein [Roseovarius sp. C7]|uniref:DUF874 domain-containing protein n=1 Tax=Roseovarius sp. C7 TaxID=3398643 RepID=UPI0039F4FA31